MSDEEITQETKKVKLETVSARDKATEIGNIVSKNFENSDDDDFDGGAFRHEDVSFSAHGWKYFMAMIREDVFIEDPGFINRGSVIPFSKSWQVNIPCPNDEAGALFHRNIRLIEMIFREEGALELYFKGSKGSI